MGGAISVPTRWPLMLVELLFDQDGTVWLSSATGVSKVTEKAFQFQGIYRYDFSELPDGVVSAIEQHFEDAMDKVRKGMNALLRRPPKPRLVLIKN
jgi:hypothetical protein